MVPHGVLNVFPPDLAISVAAQGRGYLGGRQFQKVSMSTYHPSVPSSDGPGLVSVDSRENHTWCPRGFSKPLGEAATVSPECTLPSPRRHPWASQRFVAWVSVNEQDRGRGQDGKKVWPSSGPSQTFTCHRAPYFVTISSVTMCPISLRHRAQKNHSLLVPPPSRPRALVS